jgi:tetratricopeptide (TPR) repeat protein
VPLLAPYKAWVLAVLGRTEEAARTLGPVIQNPFSYPWLLIAADTCTLLGNAELGAPIYAQLCKERFRNRVFWGPAAHSVIGPTSLVLADLALVLGRRDEALQLYDDAIALTERIGARGLAALSKKRKAQAFGAPAPVTPGRARLEVQLEGDVWRVSHGRGVLRVKDGKGMRYLAELLQNPGRELFVLELCGSEEGPSSGGATLDARAKQAYRQRVEELREQLAEAERTADTGRAERARAELDAIAGELARAVGLGGRDKQLSSNVERARINVQRRLKDAIERIRELDAGLGRYLSSTVKTGTYCSFTPI